DGGRRAKVPCQYEPGVVPRLWWQLGEKVPAGVAKIYELHAVPQKNNAATAAGRMNASPMPATAAVPDGQNDDAPMPATAPRREDASPVPATAAVLDRQNDDAPMPATAAGRTNASPVPATAAVLDGQNDDALMPATVTLKDEQGTLTIRNHDHPVLQYNYATVYPPAGVDTVFRRSGFIHPAWSPAGKVLTGIHPK